MNKRQKEVIQYQLDSEKEVLEQLQKQYQRALNDIDRKIRILESDELTQSRVYRLEYQKALKMQVDGILEKLHSDEYTTIQQFLSHSYTDAFVGTVYDMFGQGVPFIMPIDNNAAVKAVLTDSKISEGLYKALGVDTKKLKNSISAEITRGIATGMPHSEIARNIASTAKAPLSRAKTIVRTESHRIKCEAEFQAALEAKSKGADILKQWDATLDGNTRPSHQKLDGEIKELEEKFSNGMMYPGDSSGTAAEVVNCRCLALTRARVALDEEELRTLQERAEFFGLDKTEDFEDFKKKYLKAAENVDLPLEKSAKSGKIELGKSSTVSNAISNPSLDGRRNEEPLTPKQIAIAKEAAKKQGYKGDIQYSDYSGTAFHHSMDPGGFHFLVIGTDAYPIPDLAGAAVERISLNGCMAHEVVGHYEAWLKGTTQKDYYLEEAQASFRASLFGVDLTDEERQTLFEDALDRLKKGKHNLEDVLGILDIWER